MAICEGCDFVQVCSGPCGVLCKVDEEGNCTKADCVSWCGNPPEAELDLQAAERLRSADRVRIVTKGITPAVFGEVLGRVLERSLVPATTGPYDQLDEFEFIGTPGELLRRVGLRDDSGPMAK